MGILETGSIDNREQPKHFRWFLLGGAVGLVLAIILTFLQYRGAVSDDFVVKLWPTSIALMTDSSSVIVLLIAYGGNFIFYGLIALLFSLIIGFAKSFSTST